jgi:hypothetical protein
MCMQPLCLLESRTVSDNCFIFFEHSIFGSETGYPSCVCLSWLLVADEHFSFVLFLCIGLPSGICPSISPTKVLPCVTHALSCWHLIWSNNNIVFKPFWRQYIYIYIFTYNNAILKTCLCCPRKVWNCSSV